MRTEVMKTDEEQNQCFYSSEGWVWMDAYDNLPKEVRDEIKDLPINICVACINERAPTKTVEGYMQAIETIMCKLGFRVALTPKLQEIVRKLAKGKPGGFKRI